MPKTVMIVEDEEAVRELERFILEQAGYQVMEARDGLEGLAKAEFRRPDLILLDLMMPQMDGFEFIAELRKRQEWRAIPIVVITAKDLTPADHRRLNGYVQRILQKAAYSHHDLLAEIRELVTSSLQRPVAGKA